MNVASLIEELQKLNPEMEVFVRDEAGEIGAAHVLQPSFYGLVGDTMQCVMILKEKTGESLTYYPDGTLKTWQDQE